MIAKQDSCANGTAQDMAADGAEQDSSRVISALNDAFRQTCRGGMLAATAGVIGLGRGALPEILAAVRMFDAFTPDNDPYGEHDFGSLVWQGTTLFWKIDCYDPDLRYGSSDPADPSVTARVLTIMLASDY